MVPRADYLSSTKRARLPVLYLDFGLVPRTPHSDFLHWNPILYTPYTGVCTLDPHPGASTLDSTTILSRPPMVSSMALSIAVETWVDHPAFRSG